MGSYGASARSRGKAARAAMAGALVLGLVACTPLYRNHGYVPTEGELAAITVGVDTRESVIAAIGAPTSTGVLPDGDLYYVSSRFRHFGPLEPREVERELLAIAFDAGGVLRNIERFALDDGQVVTLSRRVTDDNIRDISFLRQLFGNVGNFDASTLIGE